MGNALVHMYGKCASLDDAQVVSMRIEDYNMISWNKMIGGLTEHRYGREAYELFLLMQQEGIDRWTYRALIWA